MSKLFLLLLISVGAFQQLDPQIVQVHSWRRGRGQINEQKLDITVGHTAPDYEDCIDDLEGGRQYKLLVRYNPLRGMPYDLWGVELREVLPSTNDHVEKLGDNLMVVERPGPGGDNFPRADLVGFLYPKESPHVFFDKLPFYPIRSKRIVKIENFYAVIQVNNYRFSPANPRQVESLDFTIEFKNELGLSAGNRRR
jgi:hypothetical protein